MFFRQKNQDLRFHQLEEQLSALTQDAAAVKQKLDLLTDLTETVRQFKFHTLKMLDEMETRINNQLDQLETNCDRLRTSVHKHDMAIEDLLDEWAEKKSGEDSIQAQLNEASQTEQQLLGLFEAYLEQFWNLRHYAASKDAAWASQITLMEKNLKHCQHSCAISLIQECGVSVDYDLHEIIDVTDTTDPALDKTIAEIYRCGYLYKGKVRKKAQAAAYRFSGPAS